MVPLWIKIFSVASLIVWVYAVINLYRANSVASAYGGGLLLIMWIGIIIFPITLGVAWYTIIQGKSMYWIVPPLILFMVGMFGIYEYKFSSQVETHGVTVRDAHEQERLKGVYESALQGDVYIFSEAEEKFSIKIASTDIYLYIESIDLSNSSVVRYTEPIRIGTVEGNEARIQTESGGYAIDTEFLNAFKNKMGKTLVDTYTVVHGDEIQ